MNRKMYAAGAAAIAGLLTSSAALAADATRSSAALPVAQTAVAPTNGVRTATKLEKKSKAIGRNQMIGLGIVAAVAVGGAIVVATQDDEPDSAG